MIVHRSNITGLIDRLEKRRLVQRRPTADDRRAYSVVLTLAGRKLVAKILPHYYEAAEKVWSQIPRADTRAIVKRLEQLAAGANALAARWERGQ